MCALKICVIEISYCNFLWGYAMVEEILLTRVCYWRGKNYHYSFFFQTPISVRFFATKKLFHRMWVLDLSLLPWNQKIFFIDIIIIMLTMRFFNSIRNRGRFKPRIVIKRKQNLNEFKFCIDKNTWKKIYVRSIGYKKAKWNKSIGIIERESKETGKYIAAILSPGWSSWMQNETNYGPSIVKGMKEKRRTREKWESQVEKVRDKHRGE